MTFAELRAYEPGDDVRHIDWNVTARLGRPFVRRFVEERSLVFWLVVDASASMRFGAEGRTKADRAAQAAALLATAAIHGGDRVGLLILGDRVELELPPAGGARRLAQIVRALVAAPSNFRKGPPGEALDRLRRSSRRTMMVLLGDFQELDSVGSWRRAARRNDIIAIRVTHPLEHKLPDAGLLAVEDAETGARLVVDSHSAARRRAYARDAEERRLAFVRWCASAGVDGHAMSTETEPLQTLMTIFQRRAARRSRP